MLLRLVLWVMLRLLLLLLLLGLLLSLHLLLFGLWRAHVSIFDHFHDIHSIIFSIGKTFANEILSLCGYCRLIRKLDISGLQDDVLLQNCGLRLIMSKWLFAIEALVENDTE